MKAPLQITFRNMEPDPIVEEYIRTEADKLATFYNSIMRVRVAVEMPHRHRTKGIPYNVTVDMKLPGGEIVVNRQPNPRSQARTAGKIEVKKSLELPAPRKDLRATIEEVFRMAGRRLQDYARRQSGAVKVHKGGSRGRVTRLLPEQSYGFLTTEDGQEIYFHQRSVLNGGFFRLHVGTPVTFVEEAGEKGPQASTVRIVRKPGPRSPAGVEAIAAM